MCTGRSPYICLMSSAGIGQYSAAPSHHLAVDCIIFGVEGDTLKLLLFKREIEPLAGEWSLLGSFVKDGESVDDAAHRVLVELTGIKDIYMEQLHCFGDVGRDPGGRVVSVGYWSLIKIDQAHHSFEVDDHVAEWVSIHEVPDLILDHNHMVELAKRRLRERARFYPIGIELVPEEFTLLQLFGVYQAIYDRPLDERNFRKKIQKSGLVEQLAKKDKTTSRKGSFLYKFDWETYQRLQEEGADLAF